MNLRALFILTKQRFYFVVAWCYISRLVNLPPQKTKYIKANGQKTITPQITKTEFILGAKERVKIFFHI